MPDRCSPPIFSAGVVLSVPSGLSLLHPHVSVCSGESNRSICCFQLAGFSDYWSPVMLATSTAPSILGSLFLDGSLRAGMAKKRRPLCVLYTAVYVHL